MNSLVRARSLKARVLAAGVLVLAGCSDRELEPDQPYDYASSSSSSGYGVGGSGGSGGGEGGGEEGGGGSGGGELLEACPEEPEPFEASLTRDDGFDACGPGTWTVDLRGEVLEASLSEDGTLVWTLSACVAGDPACTPLVYKLAVKAPGLDVTAPPGTFVEVRYSSSEDLERPVGDPCRDLVVVRNLPELGGAPNPSGSDSSLWFAGSSQSYYLDDERWLKIVHSQGPRCAPGDAEEAKEGAETHVLVGSLAFAAEDLESARVEVMSGAEATWEIPAPSVIAGTYDVRTLNAFDVYRVSLYPDGTVSNRTGVGSSREWVLERKVP